MRPLGSARRTSRQQERGDAGQVPDSTVHTVGRGWGVENASVLSSEDKLLAKRRVILESWDLSSNLERKQQLQKRLGREAIAKEESQQSPHRVFI